MGLAIVFTGLTLLCLALSRLHAILEIWDVKKQLLKNFFRRKDNLAEIEGEDAVEQKHIKDLITHYQLFIDHIGQPFTIEKLTEFAQSRGISSPQKDLDRLIYLGVIIPDKPGYFRWKDALKLSEFYTHIKR